MNKLFLFFILLPSFIFSQIQVGQDINGEAANDHFGFNICLSSDGTIVAIGALLNSGNGTNSGHVRVYKNIANVWTQVGSDIDGETAGDKSGTSVSLSSDGSIIAIGATRNDGNGTNSGHVRMYKNIANVWTQVGGDIDGETAFDESGFSLSLSSDGSIVAIGSTRNAENGSSSGHVRVYKNIANVWVQVGSDIDGEAANDNSGTSVSLSSDGSIIAIGTPKADGNGFESGHVRVYKNIANVWTQVGGDIDGEAFNESGSSVSLSSDGSIVAIGAPLNDGNGSSSGHVRVYKNIVNVWVQVGSDIDGEAANDNSGTSISLSSDGSIVAIGATSNDGNGLSSGHVRIYKNIANVWTQVGGDIDGEAFDQSGTGVSLSSDGSVLTIGAPLNDGNGTNSGQVRIFDLNTILSSDSFVLSQFNLYPNPVKEQFTIQLNQGLVLQKVNLYNSLGQFISSTTKHIVNTVNLSQGLYFIEIETNKGKASKKIIIE